MADHDERFMEDGGVFDEHAPRRHESRLAGHTQHTDAESAPPPHLFSPADNERRGYEAVATVNESTSAVAGADGADDGDNRHLHFALNEDQERLALARENTQKEKKLKNIKADPWRFAVAPIFALLSITNAMQWIAFSPIVNEVRDFFSMSATQVNFLATTYVIAYVAIVFLSCKLYEITGIKNGVLVAAVANLLGATVKIIALYAWPHSPLLYIAQVLNSFTEVLTIATPPLIANRWFPESERTVALTIMASALNFGCGIGVIIPTFFVSTDKHAKHNFGNLFFFHFALSAAMLLLTIFLFPKSPRYSASFAADRQQHKENERLKALHEAIHGKSGGANSTTDGTSLPVHSDNDAMDNEPDVADVESAGGSSHGQPNPHRQQVHRPLDDDLCASTAGSGAVAASQDPEPTAADAMERPHARPGRRSKRSSADLTAKPNDAAVAYVDETLTDGTGSFASSGSADREVEPVNVFSVVLDCLRQARHNYSFALLMLAAAAELGLIWAMATVLPQMLMPYGISESISGWIGFLNLVLGTVVCPFFMPLVERFGRRYKLILCVVAIVLVVTMVLLTVLLHFGPKTSGGEVGADNRYYVVLTFVCWGGIGGLCQNFMMPLMFEYVVELTFPMAESTSAPALTWAACLSNFVLALIFGAVLGNNPDEGKALRVFIGSTVVTAVGAAALMLAKPLHRRTDYENARKDEQVRLIAEMDEIRGAMGDDTAPAAGDDDDDDGAVQDEDGDNDNSGGGGGVRARRRGLFHGHSDESASGSSPAAAGATPAAVTGASAGGKPRARKRA